MAIDFIVSNPYLVLRPEPVITFIFFLASWVLIKFNKNVVTRSLIMIGNIFFVIFIFNFININSGNLLIYQIQVTEYEYDTLNGFLVHSTINNYTEFSINGELAYIIILLHITLLSYAVINRTLELGKKIIG